MFSASLFLGLFYFMNYQNIYNQIIQRANTRQLECYKEKHHIIPRCMGGGNEPSNIVELTAREHFICHRLLCEIYPEEKKLVNALWMMITMKTKKQIRYKINSRTYEELRKLYADNHHKKSDMNREIQRTIMINNNPMKGKKHSIETIELMKVSNTGIKNGFYGKKHNKDITNLIKEKAKNREKKTCEMCKKVIDVSNFVKHNHGANCKQSF